MAVIWKFPLHMIGGELLMPKRAKVLKVALQHGVLTLWVLVDPKETATQRRLFAVYGTGHEIDDTARMTYLDTVFDGSFVWHVFEGL